MSGAIFHSILSAVCTDSTVIIVLQTQVPVEPVYNGHLGTRYIWPLYTGGYYRENPHKVVCSILVAMTIINQ